MHSVKESIAISRSFSISVHLCHWKWELVDETENLYLFIKFLFCFVLMNEIKFGDKFPQLIHNKTIFIALKTQNACIKLYFFFIYLLFFFVLFSFGFTFISSIRTRIIIIMKSHIHVTKYFVLDAWRFTQPRKMSYDKLVHSFLHSRFQFESRQYMPSVCMIYIVFFFWDCVQSIYLRHDFIFRFFLTFLCEKRHQYLTDQFNIPINFVLFVIWKWCLDVRN